MSSKQREQRLLIPLAKQAFWSWKRPACEVGKAGTGQVTGIGTHWRARSRGEMGLDQLFT